MEAELLARRPLVGLYEDYHEGRHQLGFMTEKFRATFGHMLAAVNDNWMPLVIRARVERLGVQGLQFEDDREGSDLAWDIWRRNFLDEDAPMLFTESAKHGEAYTLTWWDHRPKTGVFGRFFSRGTRQTEAEITVEHPAQFIVRRTGGQRREFAAALKLWKDDDGVTKFANLFLPKRIYRWIDRGEGWEPYEADGAPAEENNPLGEVPVSAFTYDPQMLPCYPSSPMLCAPHNMPMVHIGYGRSVLPDVIPTQDQINLLLCHFMINSEFRSFMQRWATGLEVPKDPHTGQPVDPGYKAVVDRLWVATGEGAKFGAFPQDDPTPILDGINQRIMSLAARTRTPSALPPAALRQLPLRRDPQGRRDRPDLDRQRVQDLVLRRHPQPEPPRLRRHGRQETRQPDHRAELAQLRVALRIRIRRLARQEARDRRPHGTALDRLRLQPQPDRELQGHGARSRRPRRDRAHAADGQRHPTRPGARPAQRSPARPGMSTRTRARLPLANDVVEHDIEDGDGLRLRPRRRCLGRRRDGS
jgi:hypothetical protein